MLYFPNTLPSFAKMLIGFHDIYWRMWKNIDPWVKVGQVKICPSNIYPLSRITFYLIIYLFSFDQILR